MSRSSMELEVDLHGENVEHEHEHVDAERCTIRVAGDFDRLQVERFDRAAEGLPVSLRSVAVDLTGTTVIDSSALGCLVRLKNRMDALGGRLTVIVATTFQVTVMTASGLYDHLDVSVTESDENE